MEETHSRELAKRARLAAPIGLAASQETPFFVAAFRLCPTTFLQLLEFFTIVGTTLLASYAASKHGIHALQIPRRAIQVWHLMRP